MNRREFINKAKYLALSTTILPILGESIEIKDLYTPKDPIKDSISSKKPILNSNNIFLEKSFKESFKSVQNKLDYIQNYVGYGNFNIISFDHAANILKYSSSMKRFTKEELDFIEYIFYYEPSYHGFYGERVTSKLTSKIDVKEVEKIPYSGHYLFKGKPKETYLKLKDDIGPTIVLTSGVRSVVKQLKLFLDKLDSVNENLSITSNSIAPPAFTYHSVGDFDVGKKGLGAANFTETFSHTNEFTQMKSLKYIDMRYTVNNKDGVRYEPWHVKII